MAEDRRMVALVVALAIALIALIGVAWWWVAPGAPSPENALRTAPTAPAAAPHQPSGVQPEQGPGASGTNPPSALADRADAATSLWSIADDADIDPALLPDLGVSVRQGAVIDRIAVHLDAASWRRLGVGETIVVPVPDQTEPVRAIVSDRVEHANGDVSIVARTEHATSPGSLILTVGDRSTFASLRGSLGGYQLTGNQTGGWLMAARALGPQGLEGRQDYQRVDRPPRPVRSPLTLDPGAGEPID